jgi:hypothetical protein
VSAYRAVPPAPLTDDDLADVVEPRSVGLAFGITDDTAWFGNGILAPGDRHQPSRLEAFRRVVLQPIEVTCASWARFYFES